VPLGLQNSITSYDIAETNHVGNVTEQKSNYDLMSVVMVYLGNAMDKQQSDVLRMLNTLLSEEVRASTKLDVLSNDFRIPREQHLEREMQYMCNLSQKKKKKGIEQGIERGIEQEKFNTAKACLAKGLDIETIVSITGLDENTIKNLNSGN
jgi:predicted transposase/invertase (TIGR01784 family)